MKKFKYFIPAIAWMIYIFYMSNQNGITSTGSSSSIVDTILRTFHISSNYFDFIETLVRKAAHMSEYALLIILVFYGVSHITNERLYLTTLVIGFLYACSDEIHQLFIPGRSGQLLDVLIDTGGMLIGLIIVYLFLKIKRTSKQ